MMAQLEGHEFDLAYACQQTKAGATRVIESEGSYFLSSDAFDGASESDLVAAAEDALSRINGAAVVLNDSYRPVRLTGIFQSPDRDRTVAVGTAHTEIRVMLTAEAHVTSDRGMPQEDTEPAVLSAAHRDRAFAKAMRWMAEEPMTWNSLHKVYEIVRDAVSASGTVDKSILVRRGWISERELTSFLNSANDMRISGDDARHAKVFADPVGVAMTVAQARSVMAQVLQAWAKEICQ